MEIGSIGGSYKIGFFWGLGFFVFWVEGWSWVWGREVFMEVGVRGRKFVGGWGWG